MAISFQEPIVQAVCLGYNALQTGLLNLEKVSPGYEKVSEKVNTVFYHIDQVMFNVQTLDCIDLLSKKITFIPSLVADGFSFSGVVVAVAIAFIMGAATFVVFAKIQNINVSDSLQKNLQDKLPQDLKGRVTVSHFNTKNQADNQLELIMKAVTLVAIIAFGGFSYLNVLSLACISFSIFSLLKSKWVKYDMRLDLNAPVRGDLVRSLNISYVTKRIADIFSSRVCSTCQEEEDSKYYNLCSIHSLHEHCTIQTIFKKFESLWSDRLDPVVTLAEIQDVPGHRAAYGLYIPPNKFPACPECRETSKREQFGLTSVEVQDVAGAVRVMPGMMLDKNPELAENPA